MTIVSDVGCKVNHNILNGNVDVKKVSAGVSDRIIMSNFAAANVAAVSHFAMVRHFNFKWKKKRKI